MCRLAEERPAEAVRERPPEPQLETFDGELTCDLGVDSPHGLHLRGHASMGPGSARLEGGRRQQQLRPEGRAGRLLREGGLLIRDAPASEGATAEGAAAALPGAAAAAAEGAAAALPGPRDTAHAAVQIPSALAARPLLLALVLIFVTSAAAGRRRAGAGAVFAIEFQELGKVDVHEASAEEAVHLVDDVRIVRGHAAALLDAERGDRLLQLLRKLPAPRHQLQGEALHAHEGVRVRARHLQHRRVRVRLQLHHLLLLLRASNAARRKFALLLGRAAGGGPGRRPVGAAQSGRFLAVQGRRDLDAAVGGPGLERASHRLTARDPHLERRRHQLRTSVHDEALVEEG
mmetsp:Transcript_148119/g.475706  ORF Transcript_148119/g.475706 Transcript_148119/m.475706 type:complete len:346 (+) Transcript_148119:3564-4601(+)